MGKVWKKTAKTASLLFMGLACTLLARGFIEGHEKDELRHAKRHHLEKDLFDLSQLNDSLKDNIPGTLVCVRKKPRSEESLGRVVAEIDEVEIEQRNVEIEAPNIFDKRKGSISQLSPDRALGCCPPGDPFGDVYRPGSACCVNRIFDVLNYFCCMKNSSGIILPLNENNLDYCYPTVPFCREKDLEMERKLPMSYECQNNDNDNPEFCKFFCPKGSRPKGGIDSAKCLNYGVWNDTPECCVGCNENFQLDIWFLIQAPETPSDKSLERLKEFLATFISYLPISQDNVRVGFDVISSEKQVDVVWDLTSHNSLDEVERTVENLSFNGFGSKTGEALSWLGRNAFTPEMGDREEVENLAVVILYDPSEDSIFNGARILKERSKVIVVAIGDNVSEEDSSAIASESNTFYRVDEEERLKSLIVNLHKNICGDDCIYIQ